MHDFDDLVEAISAAFLKAHKISLAQHVELLRDWFDARPDGTQVARTVKVVIPDLDGDDEAELEIDVPYISLLPVNSLVIDGIELEFKAFMSDFNADKDDTSGAENAAPQAGGNAEPTVGATGDAPPKKAGRVKMELMGAGARGKDLSNVSVKITMKGQEPPEGLVKINDNILKHIP